MCTVTWVRSTGGYRVLFNRDEHRIRPPALPPAIVARGARRILMPRDGAAGGTWLGVNDLGLTVGLLNHYPRRFVMPPEPASRGFLVSDLLLEPDVRSVALALRARSLSDLPPFLLFAIDAAHGPSVHAWDGVRLAPRAAHAPLTTSSYDTKAVVAARRSAFPGRDGKAPPSEADLLSYHRGHVPAATAYSVCMHRDDARTVSFSRVVVEGAVATFLYLPGPPCRTDMPGTHAGIALVRPET